MTVLSPRRCAVMRRKFSRYIFNDETSVRMAVSESTEQIHPDYITQPVKIYHEFTGLKHTCTHLLSGKLGRILRAEFGKTLSRWGMIDNATFIIQYLTHSPELLVATSEATNTSSSKTNLDDTEVDFIALGVRIGAKVINISDNSSADVITIATTKLITAELTGGIANCYCLGDSYKVYNYNDLQINDQIYIDGKWREILDSIRDSTGVQTSVLLGE